MMTIASRDDRLTVTVTDAGLPTALRISPDLMSQPRELATGIVLLCRQGSARLAADARRDYAEAGVPASFLTAMNLATSAQAADAELAADTHCTGQRWGGNRCYVGPALGSPEWHKS